VKSLRGAIFIRATAFEPIEGSHVRSEFIRPKGAGARRGAAQKAATFRDRCFLQRCGRRKILFCASPFVSVPRVASKAVATTQPIPGHRLSTALWVLRLVGAGKDPPSIAGSQRNRRRDAGCPPVLAADDLLLIDNLWPDRLPRSSKHPHFRRWRLRPRNCRLRGIPHFQRRKPLLPLWSEDWLRRRNEQAVGLKPLDRRVSCRSRR
jgi:hypothetical protein